MHTTLNKLIEYGIHEATMADITDYFENRLDESLSVDDKVEMAEIHDAIGTAEFVWLLRIIPGHDKEWRLLACDCADAAIKGYGKRRAMYPRLVHCIDVARNLAIGRSSAEAVQFALESTANAHENPGDEQAVDAACATLHESAAIALFDACAASQEVGLAHIYPKLMKLISS